VIKKKRYGPKSARLISARYVVHIRERETSKE